MLWRISKLHTAPLSVDPGELLYQCYGRLWYPSAVCCEKVSWSECRSWAWPLKPRQEGLGSAAVSIAYQKATCIERSRPEATLLGPGERERKRSSPLWLEGWAKPTRGFLGMSEGKRVFPEDRTRFLFLPRWRIKTNHDSLSRSPDHSLKYANGHKFLADLGKP